ncbi:MAG: NAD(P)/FAD-dependent oxidoreductase [Deltaproteobacteria bacterium]|nr:MAG: NAD(P)/FAD-dependent oxidoreductase [Deltaproteobacteria bacterium]
MSESSYDAIVIGAGGGGVSCASILAKRGLKTLILEQSDIIGGCCSTFEDQGFHFDTGASIVMFVPALDAIFERLGKKREDYIDLRLCDPIYSFRYPSGEYLEIPRDIHETYEVFKKVCPEDAEAWLDYCEFWKQNAEQGMVQYLHNDMQSWRSFLKMASGSSGMGKYLPAFYLNYELMIRKWFKSETALNIMGFQSYWIGLPPKLCPGLYAAISYSEHEGIYYPMGGMISIPKGILAVGQENGLELRLNTEVTKVIVENRKVRGVVLKDGTKLSSKLVVSNINAQPLYLKLIGEENLPRRVIKGIKSYELSMCMPMIYLGIKGDVPLRAHHSLQLGHYQEHNDIWDKYFLTGKFPEKPICLMCWPTETDPSLAPEGHHALNLGAMGSYKLDHGTWDERRDEFMDRVLGFVEETLWPGISSQIVYKNLSTPMDFERRLLSPEGAIYALKNDILSTMVFRPANRSKCIEGLYLVGASTHPGGGVPMVIAGGGITADLVMEDYQKL